jgi:3-oxoacyl-[acyl-carrier-protein] synthase II
LGSGIGGLETFKLKFLILLPEMEHHVSIRFLSQNDRLLLEVTIKYGFRGPNFTTVSACASSTNAMIDAFNYID